MDKFVVQVAEEPTVTQEVVSQGLREFNRSFLGEYESEPIAIDLRDASGEIVGGALGALQLGWLFIDVVWISEPNRLAGLGSKVLEALEQEAVRRGANRSILDTMGFQAEQFYAKRGYAECGRVPNFASGYDRVYMTKVLDS